MLRAAAAVACPRLVDLLADAGVSTHVTDDDARTPLHWAALAGDTRSLARLLFGTKSHADYLTFDPLPSVARQARSRNQETITNSPISESARASLAMALLSKGRQPSPPMECSWPSRSAYLRKRSGAERMRQRRLADEGAPAARARSLPKAVVCV